MLELIVVSWSKTWTWSRWCMDGVAVRVSGIDKKSYSCFLDTMQ